MAYELVFLLSPMLPAEAAAAVVASDLKPSITAAGGTVLDELPPRLLPLAYPVKQVVEHKTQIFTDAYRGTINFAAPSAALGDLDRRLKDLPVVIRFMITRQPATRPDSARLTAMPPAPLGAAVAAAASRIDKEIDDLLTV